ncbi:retrovirus-related Pol polyprotein from transposon opus [Trichonephila clavipes]|uniref:Retrovirus-related Pol polyprotein from transposon opus n=1 Tax=Trichonephila clavipes TaxID=2585209 RepID=A0A8X6VPK5_TRICX|nr:retrovirus-related Pol polyprotein from transposon opus [Trichonephila clavipes]
MTGSNKEIDDHIEKMLQEGRIRPIQSPYASPVVLTRKNSDLPPDSPEAYRFAIDYRKLNAITKYPRYPLPVIDDLNKTFCKPASCRHWFLNVVIFSIGDKSERYRENRVYISQWYLCVSQNVFRLFRGGAKFPKGHRHYIETYFWAFHEETPILHLPNFKEQFNLLTDTSGVGIGAVLNQHHRPIAFASRTPNKAGRNYTVTEHECLEVIWALNKFKTYFGSLPVKVITDHAALTKLTNGENLSSRMIRWALKLSEFNIEWEHRPGVQNVVANVLSRNPVGNMDGSQSSCAAPRALALNSRDKLIREKREDPELGHIYRYLEYPDDGSVKGA